MANIDVDVDVDDIFYTLSKKEKKEMYDLLHEELNEENDLFLLFEKFQITIPKKPSNMEVEFLSALMKVFKNRNVISYEDEKFFINYAKKF